MKISKGQRVVISGYPIALNAIKTLLDLAPDTARVLKDGDEIELSAEEVKKEDTVFSGTIISTYR